MVGSLRFLGRGGTVIFSLSNLLSLWIQLLSLRNAVSAKAKFVGVSNWLKDLFTPHPDL